MPRETITPEATTKDWPTVPRQPCSCGRVAPCQVACCVGLTRNDARRRRKEGRRRRGTARWARTAKPSGPYEAGGYCVLNCERTRQNQEALATGSSSSEAIYSSTLARLRKGNSHPMIQSRISVQSLAPAPSVASRASTGYPGPRWAAPVVRDALPARGRAEPPRRTPVRAG